MRAARLVLLVGLALASGLVVGTGLAPLPYTSNDECSSPPDGYVAAGAEGAVYDASLQLWPLRMRCSYDVGGGQTRSRVLGPGIAETIGWSALVALLVIVALHSRRAALLRGAILAACFLAPVVAGLLYSEFVLALWVAVLIGAPLVLVLDYALRPSGERRWSQSLLIAGALSPIVFFACFFFDFAGYSRIGIAAGILAGALAALALPRLWSRAIQISAVHS